jgi:hypothetical protein
VIGAAEAGYEAYDAWWSTTRGAVDGMSGGADEVARAVTHARRGRKRLR